MGPTASSSWSIGSWQKKASNAARRPREEAPRIESHPQPQPQPQPQRNTARGADELRGMSEGTLLWGVLFSSIGVGFCIYGKRQQAPVPLLCGIGLVIYPYFIPNVLAVIAIGIVLCAIPYFFRK